MSELAAPGSTPSLNEVRDKIEARYARALGSAELAQDSVEGRMLEVQKSTLEMAGSSRLDQIRASMAGKELAAPPPATAPPLASGTPAATPAAEADKTL
jgi:phage shock protein A